MALSEKSLHTEAVWEAKSSRWHSETCARAWRRAELFALHNCYFSALPCLHNQTDTNQRGKYICYAESLIFNPISEKHLWIVSLKWNNCVKGISKVKLTQPNQENSCALVPFSSSLYASEICLHKKHFHAWLHFFSLQRGKKFYQSSVTWDWNPFSTAFSVQQWNIWTPAGNCTYSLKIMISFPTFLLLTPASSFNT